VIATQEMQYGVVQVVDMHQVLSRCEAKGIGGAGRGSAPIRQPSGAVRPMFAKEPLPGCARPPQQLLRFFGNVHVVGHAGLRLEDQFVLADAGGNLQVVGGVQ
jgi:hypothetical protein